MTRHSKIINFSLSPQQYDELDSLAVASGRNRSELMRSIISASLQGMKQRDVGSNTIFRENNADIASMLKDFWLARTSSPLEIKVAGLIIAVNDEGRVLIGKRHQTDPNVPNLTWSFPGSRLQTLDFQKELTKSFHERTGLHVNINKVVAARVIPESGQNGAQVVALYAHGPVQGNQHFTAQAPYSELKWVKPLDVFKYFTSSTTDEVTAFLNSLDSASDFDPK